MLEDRLAFVLSCEVHTDPSPAPHSSSGDAPHTSMGAPRGRLGQTKASARCCHFAVVRPRIDEAPKTDKSPFSSCFCENCVGLFRSHGRLRVEVRRLGFSDPATDCHTDLGARRGAPGVLTGRTSSWVWATRSAMPR